MGRSDKLFEGKDVALGLAWYAAGIGFFFVLGLLLSGVVNH
ncbi:MAG: hypothetical protein ACYCV0_12015 [Desulfitobacteriaceae bacterium]